MQLPTILKILHQVQKPSVFWEAELYFLLKTADTINVDQLTRKLLSSNLFAAKKQFPVVIFFHYLTRVPKPPITFVKLTAILVELSKYFDL